jgi:peptidoglycan/xylan/chitin deacetylase (PgdA/CDA1 family)
VRTIYHCFPEGRHKALTMSYDDGTVADRRLVDIFNRHGIKGTFHLNAGLFGRADRIGADEVKDLYEGHEVAAHTYTHPTIARCPSDQVIQQVIEDRKSLESIVGYPVRGLSYPNGSHDKRIRDLLPHTGIEYSRVVESTRSFSMPEDLYRWQPTCHHNHDLMALANSFVAQTKTAYLFLMYVWGHSFEFDRQDNWDLIEEFCKYVGGREDVWYATNIEIVDYLDILRRLKFSANGDFVYNPSARSAWIAVDGTVIEVKGGTQISI